MALLLAVVVAQTSKQTRKTVGSAVWFVLRDRSATMGNAHSFAQAERLAAKMPVSNSRLAVTIVASAITLVVAKKNAKQDAVFPFVRRAQPFATTSVSIYRQTNDIVANVGLPALRIVSVHRALVFVPPLSFNATTLASIHKTTALIVVAATMSARLVFNVSRVLVHWFVRREPKLAMFEAGLH